MAGVYGTTYLISEESASSWWKSIPNDYVVYRCLNKGELHDANFLGEWDFNYGIGWEVSAKNHPTSKVGVDVWRPKELKPPKLRIDISWHADKLTGIQSCKTTAKMVEGVLLALGAQPSLF